MKASVGQDSELDNSLRMEHHGVLPLSTPDQVKSRGRVCLIEPPTKPTPSHALDLSEIKTGHLSQFRGKVSENKLRDKRVSRSRLDSFQCFRHSPVTHSKICPTFVPDDQHLLYSEL